MNQEAITKLLQDIFHRRSKVRERKVTMLAFCEGRGFFVDHSDASVALCDDPECTSCQMIKKHMINDERTKGIEGIGGIAE